MGREAGLCGIWRWSRLRSHTLGDGPGPDTGSRLGKLVRMAQERWGRMRWTLEWMGNVVVVVAVAAAPSVVVARWVSGGEATLGTNVEIGGSASVRSGLVKIEIGELGTVDANASSQDWKWGLTGCCSAMTIHVRDWACRLQMRVGRWTGSVGERNMRTSRWIWLHLGPVVEWVEVEKVSLGEMYGVHVVEWVAEGDAVDSVISVSG